MYRFSASPVSMSDVAWSIPPSTVRRLVTVQDAQSIETGGAFDSRRSSSRRQRSWIPMPSFPYGVQGVDITTLRTEPGDGLAPGVADRGRGVGLAHPAAAMEIVVVLLLQHLFQPAA